MLIHGANNTNASPVTNSDHTSHEVIVELNDPRAAEQLERDAREDRLLREANGVRDAVAFPRYRAMGIPESELHAAVMHDVRLVQYGLDEGGGLQRRLGVRFSGIHGTVADAGVR